jgi:hypothetical protein
MARKNDLHKIGAKRMWIRRWLKVGKIVQSEAARFTKHLERTGELLKPSVKSGASKQAQVSPVTDGGQRGSLVTIQYDPSRFRVEFTAIRRGRPANSTSTR